MIISYVYTAPHTHTTIYPTCTACLIASVIYGWLRSLNCTLTADRIWNFKKISRQSRPYTSLINPQRPYYDARWLIVRFRSREAGSVTWRFRLYGYTGGRCVQGVNVYYRAYCICVQGANVYYRAYCTCLRVISWPRTRLWSPKCRNFLRYYCTQRLQMLIAVDWSVSVERKSHKRIDTFFAFCCMNRWLVWCNLLLKSLWWSARSDPS